MLRFVGMSSLFFVAAAGCGAESGDDAASTLSADTAGAACAVAPCAARPVIFIHGHGGGQNDGDAIFAALTAPGERFDAATLVGTDDHATWAANSFPRRSWLFSFSYYVANGDDARGSFTAGPGRIGSDNQLCADHSSYDQGEGHEYTHDLATMIDDVLRATGAHQVDIVTHSMGGLVTRSYLTFVNGARARIANVMFLSTPHLGVPGASDESVITHDQSWMADHELTELDRWTFTSHSDFSRCGGGRDRHVACRAHEGRAGDPGRRRPNDALHEGLEGPLYLRQLCELRALRGLSGRPEYRPRRNSHLRAGDRRDARGRRRYVYPLVPDGLRLIVYDRTCVTRGNGLTTAWWLGSSVYRGLGRADASFGAASWTEALAWLAAFRAGTPIAQIQYWGHGKWGRMLIDSESFDASSLPLLAPVRERLAPDAFFWIRTCETFGADAGIDFAQRLADTLGAHVAGHTFIIGAIQSGLRTLAPGRRPTWSRHEGLTAGTPEAPRGARDSSLLAPRTVHCLSRSFPRSWFAEDGA